MPEGFRECWYLAHWKYWYIDCGNTQPVLGAVDPGTGEPIAIGYLQSSKKSSPGRMDFAFFEPWLEVPGPNAMLLRGVLKALLMS